MSRQTTRRANAKRPKFSHTGPNEPNACRTHCACRAPNCAYAGAAPERSFQADEGLDALLREHRRPRPSEEHLRDHDQHPPINHGFNEFFGTLYDLREESRAASFIPRRWQNRRHGSAQATLTTCGSLQGTMTSFKSAIEGALRQHQTLSAPSL